LSSLQQAEDEAAQIQGRDPKPVAIDEGAEEGEYGYYDGSTIYIGEHSLNNDDVSEVANTLAHEGRHAYQDYAIEHPGFHPDTGEVQSWEENQQPGNYVKPDQGQAAYLNQPVERDAWPYGDRIANGVYGVEAIDE